ncbi:MAG TPA: hypothetical protein VFS43_06660 [Polyangiaceae bacterium]|nr:hypothetical protein [Polyangiaceae bacterium]
MRLTNVEGPRFGPLASRSALVGKVLSALTRPASALLCGPRHMGRHYVAREIERRWSSAHGGVVAHARFEASSSPAKLLEDLATSLGVAVRHAELVAGLGELGARVGRPMLLVLDGYDAVIDDLRCRVRFGDALRGVGQYFAARKLPVFMTLLLVGEGSEGHLMRGADYFRDLVPFELSPLTQAEVAAALALFGLDALIGLYEPTGGVGGLLMPALEHASRTGVGAEQLLAEASSADSPFAPVLLDVRGELAHDPPASALWKSIVKHAETGGIGGPDKIKEKLYRLGLVRADALHGPLRPSSSLFAEQLAAK